MSNPIGVITEQGYAAGQGLGYNPFNENDLKKLREKENENYFKKLREKENEDKTDKKEDDK